MISQPTSREFLQVELVDEAGRALGSATVDAAHRDPGRLHRAFSVLLVDAAGRLLLQRRAATKTRFPLRWANTCCGHPAPGQPVTEAARQRLVEELGVHGVAFAEVGVHRYRADDPATGRVEHEYDHVLVGRIDAATPLNPNPDEVAAVRWARVAELPAAIAADPTAYAPWLAGVLATLTDAVSTGDGPLPPGGAPAPRGGGMPTPPNRGAFLEPGRQTAERPGGR